MRNHINSGEEVVLTAPRTLVSGNGFRVGQVFAVALTDAANATAVVGKRVGRVTLPINPADNPTVGALLYWDNTNVRLTTTLTGNLLVGFAATVKSAANTIEVVLTGQVA
jgi:predicted RecA/RadA family phage recombinase